MYLILDFRAPNNSRTSDNFRAYSLNVQPKWYLGGHYVQTYPIVAAELLEPSYTSYSLPQTGFNPKVIESLDRTTRCQTTAQPEGGFPQLEWWNANIHTCSAHSQQTI